MSKTKVILIIIISVLIAWVFSIFPGRFLAAKISTLPILNKWQILSPQGPIVITNRETVRVSDSGDLAQAANQASSKISAVVFAGPGGTGLMGTAINLSSDGSFVTAQGTFASKTGNYFVILSDGRSAQISQQVLDPITSLVFFKASLGSVPAASFGDSKTLSAGDKLLFVQSSSQAFKPKVSAGFVSFAESYLEGRVFMSDYPRRGFGAVSQDQLLSGQAVVSASGEIMGIWNGSEVISSDVLKETVALYFSGQGKIIRPEFGFSYLLITKTAAALSNQPEGALVKDLSGSSPAHQAGLLSGDVITAVNNQTVSEGSPLEEILENYKPGDTVNFLVSRKNQTFNLTFKVGELK